MTACPPIQSFALERELALRVSGLDGGEEIRVGLAGVEQAADSVASEVHEPERERDSLDALGEGAHAADLSDSTDRGKHRTLRRPESRVLSVPSRRTAKPLCVNP